MVNKTYNYIKEYINENKEILDKNDLKLLSKYAYEIKEKNIENVNVINIKDIIKDLNNLNNNIKNTDNTSILKNRLLNEVSILDDLYNGADLNDVSYELDKLYLLSDLPVREKSSLIYKLKNNKGKSIEK